jgi:hypothetical protein
VCNGRACLALQYFRGTLFHLSSPMTTKPSPHRYYHNNHSPFLYHYFQLLFIPMVFGGICCFSCSCVCVAHVLLAAGWLVGEQVDPIEGCIYLNPSHVPEQWNSAFR